MSRVELPQPDFSFDCDGTPCYYKSTVERLVKEAELRGANSYKKDAERYRLLRDFDGAQTELAICKWSEHGWSGEWVIEHDPDSEIDDVLAKDHL